MLQTRNAKRPAQAAVRFAVDAVEEGLLERGGGDRHDRRGQARRAAAPAPSPPTPSSTCSPRAWPRRRAPPRARSSSPPTTRSPPRRTDRDVILVRPFTEADDVAGFYAAKGILTSEGGKASHAALVARGMGKPCVAGAGDLEIDLNGEDDARGRHRLSEGDLIAIDGTAGVVTADDVPLEEPEVERQVRDRARRGPTSCASSACARTPTPPRTPRKAREFGAEGIGLCRTRAHVHGRRAPARRCRR